MANVILIAGTYHGGWYWDGLADNLRALGHSVFAPTLSGLDATGPSDRAVNLDTHINDVLSIIDDNQLTEVVIVGWSYGGMVVTGVADRTKAKIKALVYLDAWAPKSGQAEWDLIPDYDKPGFLASCTDGLNLRVNPGLLAHEPRMTTHPLATKLQPLHFDEAKFAEFKKVFVHGEKWFHDPAVPSPFVQILDRARVEPNWQAHSWPVGHDLYREAPDQVQSVILEALA
ncbi:MAG: hypothetical protein RIQ44_793 [Actinomycetota bacterium]